MRKTCSWKENSTSFIHQNLSTRVYRNAKSAEYSFYNNLKVQHIALCNNMSDRNWSLLSSQDMWRCPVWSRNPLPVTSSPHRPLGSPARAGMWKGRTSCCLSPVTCCSVCNTSMGHMSWGGGNMPESPPSLLWYAPVKAFEQQSAGAGPYGYTVRSEQPFTDLRDESNQI